MGRDSEIVPGAACLLAPGKGPRPEENLQFWTPMALTPRKASDPTQPLGRVQPLLGSRGTHQGPQGNWLGSRRHIQLHSTTSSICSTNSVTHTHTHTHTGNVVEVRGASEARGGQQRTQGPSEHAYAEVLSILGRGQPRRDGGTSDYSSKTCLA